MTERRHRQKRKILNPRYHPVERRRSRNWALILFGSAAVFLLLQRNFIGSGIVTDVSMLPTLRPDSYFLINKYVYRLRSPLRGEIVMFRTGPLEREYYVKRVVGLEGEKVSFREGRVYINGEALAEPYASGPTYPEMGELAVAPGTCYLLGDNRENSEDSRNFGSVPVDLIEGKFKPFF